MKIERVAVLGSGLLGGSLALRLGGELDVRLWARRESSVAQAKAMGVRGATGDLEEAVADADLVVLGVPVGAMPGLAARAIEAGMKRDGLLTDVGSVKRIVHRELAPVLKDSGIRFIGGHPMAGAEVQGMGAARADLFEGAMCLLTDDDMVGDPWSSALESFWKGVGCRTHWMSGGDHDALVARISHLPHVMAAATAMVALAEPAEARFGGGGLRDTTRVAGGDADMWAEILLENGDEVAATVARARDFLSEILASLEAGDHEATRRWLVEARRLHGLGRDAIQDERA